MKGPYACAAGVVTAWDTPGRWVVLVQESHTFAVLPTTRA